MREQDTAAFGELIYSLLIFAFLAIKIGGTSLAAWSFWWVGFPIPPLLDALGQHLLAAL